MTSNFWIITNFKKSEYLCYYNLVQVPGYNACKHVCYILFCMKAIQHLVDSCEFGWILYKHESHAEMTTAIRKLHVKLLQKIEWKWGAAETALQSFESEAPSRGRGPVHWSAPDEVDLMSCAKQTTALISMMIAKTKLYYPFKKKIHRNTEETVWRQSK